MVQQGAQLSLEGRGKKHLRVILEQLAECDRKPRRGLIRRRRKKLMWLF